MNFGFLEGIRDVELLEDIDLRRFTTIRLKTTGSIAIVSSVEALRAIVMKLNEKNIQYHMIGWGANQVISRTSGVLFIKLKIPLDMEIFKEPREEYVLPASAPLNLLQSHAQKFGLKGWEVFTGIPASLGGAIFMNAGTALGEIGALVKSVTLLRPNGKFRVASVNSNSFSYRKNHFVEAGEIIVEATLVHQGLSAETSEKIKDYMEFRKSTQPLRSFNCGCVWKNHDENHKAGLFIDKLGLNNIKFNDLEVSDMHSNFLENKENASIEDFNSLIELMSDQLLLHSGIRFELEAKVY